MKNSILILGLVLYSSLSFSQQFINGDLEGRIDGMTSLPDGWQNVPYDDKACQAVTPNQSTPDLTDTLGPDTTWGIAGRPQSGDNFVCGDFGGMDNFHEGIQQKLTGLIPGMTYRIHFYQAVVKQKYCLDTTGGWAVYQDDKLISRSSPSTSHLTYDSLDLQWDKRSMEFKATAESHVIKFLPYDDDNVFDYYELNGTLRMGIDNISLEELPDFEIVEDLDMLLYPNPTLGQFTVQTDLEEYELIIMNPLGQIVYNKSFCSYNTVLELDLRGSFMVMIKTEEQYTTDWIIIQ